LEIDEDQETIPSDRKEYEGHMDLEETIRTSDRKEYESHMDLEPDHETIRNLDKSQRVTWTLTPLSSRLARLHRSQTSQKIIVTVRTHSLGYGVFGKSNI
jgi:hypothetical protein